MHMETFLTVLSWVFLMLFLIRAYFIIWAKRSAQEQMIIKMAENSGIYPIADALRVPFIGIIICGAWILAKAFFV